VTDWWLIARDAVWILGAAICIATWSWHQRLVMNAIARGGAVLFCIGVASVSRWWEAIVWVGIGCLSLFSSSGSSGSSVPRQSSRALPEELRGTEELDWRARVRAAMPQIVIGAIIGTGAFALAVRGVDWRAVGDALLHTRGSMVALAFVSVSVAILLSVARWRILFAPEHRDLEWSALTGAILVGQTANIVIPARVGELARIYLIGRREQLSKARVTATIVVEKVTDLAVFAVSIVLCLVAMTLPSWMSRSGEALVATAAVFLAATLALTFWSGALLRLVEMIAARLPQAWGVRLVRVAEAALGGLRSLRDWRFALVVSLLSGAILLVSITTNYIVFLAMRMSLPPVAALLLTIVLRIGIAPPSLPGRLGLFQYLIVLALAMFGVDRTAALSYSFALYAIAVLPVLILGTVWLFAFRWTPWTRG